MKWTLCTKKIKDLKENPNNPRRLSTEQAAHLHESISKFGQVEPIVCNSDNIIIGGHQRLRTMKKMGYKEVEVYIPETKLEEKEAEELNIRLNKNTGDWDYEILANVWDPEELLSWGFTEKELSLDDPEIKPKDTSKKTKMIITFSTPEQLQEAENQISTILDKYDGATYKLKV